MKRERFSVCPIIPCSHKFTFIQMHPAAGFDACQISQSWERIQPFLRSYGSQLNRGDDP